MEAVLLIVLPTNNMQQKLALVIGCGLMVACNSGGSGSEDGSNSVPGSTPTPTITINPNSVDPNPYPTPLTYPMMPDGFATALPTFVTTTNLGLQIAYGHNSNPQAPNLVAYINQYVAGQGTYICSATPVASDGVGGTWLVGAAHCYLSGKAQAAVVSGGDILPMSSISVLKGVYGQKMIASSAQVFIPKNYCQGAIFSGLGECPNFGPSEGALGGQGNDIALIRINATFNTNESYPRLAQAFEYPQPYTMAPVLSLGYGDNNVNGGNGTLFYVVNYFYQQQNITGYNYLLNSYFNPSAGYSALVCGGDSGGPDLHYNGSQWLLLSVHTFGPAGSCGKFYNTLPNGATNVSAYYSWSTNIINSGALGATAYCQTESADCVTNG